LHGHRRDFERGDAEVQQPIRDAVDVVGLESSRDQLAAA
jgi:hypothetical protein